MTDANNNTIVTTDLTKQLLDNIKANGGTDSGSMIGPNFYYDRLQLCIDAEIAYGSQDLEDARKSLGDSHSLTKSLIQRLSRLYGIMAIISSAKQNV